MRPGRPFATVPATSSKRAQESVKEGRASEYRYVHNPAAGIIRSVGRQAMFAAERPQLLFQANAN